MNGDEFAQQLLNGACLVATNQRVIALSAAAINASPKEPVVSIERSALTGKKKVMFVKMPTLTLQVGSPEGPGSIGFEIPKAARKGFEAVLAALNST